MERVQLARLVQWSGKLRGRKRLQKVVCLLREAGCQMKTEFFLHHYGPYSRDVAEACDALAAAGLLEESTSQNPAGVEYAYELSDRTGELLQQAAQHAELGPALAELERYQPLARRLLDEDVAKLELASTIAFFHRTHRDWNSAVQKACEFKKVDPACQSARDAATLAREAVEWTP